MNNPTPYPEVNARLREVLDGARAILGPELVGFYVNGSLAAGDFDPAHSDVDFVAAVARPLPPESVDALAAMHRAITASGRPYAYELEGSYVPLAALRRHDPADTVYANLERGPDEALRLKEHHSDWVIQRHILREHGIALYGPPPSTLVDPVSRDELRAATAAVLRSWWGTPAVEDVIAHASPGYLAYVVQTMCRALYSLAHGAIISKPAASRWALAEGDHRWHNLIERALRWEVTAADADDIIAFVRRVVAAGETLERRGTEMATEFDRELEERLVRYVQIDTQSHEASPTSPSTDKQYDLLRLLADELRAIGAQDVRLTDYGAVLATIPSTVAHDTPRVGFLAHVDTAPDYSGAGVKPIVHRAYAGGDIALPDDPSKVLSPADLPYLAAKVGDDIITASGTTLLGADDKAGVAIVMTMAHHLLRNPDIPHGPIRVCFTPDEEIGRGVHADLPADLDVDAAYTLDGGPLGELVQETFSADKAVVQITGVAAHPGYATGRLVNAIALAARIVDTLPRATLTPETTEGRDGFIHVYKVEGNPAATSLHFILRDFEVAGLEAKGELLRQVCATIQATEPRAQITCEITPQYRNMRYWLEDDSRPVDLASEAYRAVGLEPHQHPIRGGTDGSRLTERGVPTPNLFTGMQAIHSPLEWISVQDMAAATQVCVKLAELWGRVNR